MCACVPMFTRGANFVVLCSQRETDPGRKISEDPDDEASTSAFVDVSEVFPGALNKLMDAVANILAGSLLDEGCIVCACAF